MTCVLRPLSNRGLFFGVQTMKNLIIDGPVLVAATAFIAAAMNLIARIFKAKTEDGENAFLVALAAFLICFMPFGMWLVVWLK